MSNKDDGSPSNPMLYDPIPEGPGDTKKLMQFVASSIGKYIFNFFIKPDNKFNSCVKSMLNYKAK